MMRAALLAGAVVVATASGAATIGGPVLVAPASCESIASMTLPHAAITSAAAVDAGAFVAPSGPGAPAGSGPFARLPAFCRVAATLRPSSDSDIKIEVWLPASGWNGKFEGVGNGGWSGNIAYGALAALGARLRDGVDRYRAHRRSAASSRSATRRSSSTSRIARCTR